MLGDGANASILRRADDGSYARSARWWRHQFVGTVYGGQPFWL